MASPDLAMLGCGPGARAVPLVNSCARSTPAWAMIHAPLSQPSHLKSSPGEVPHMTNVMLKTGDGTPTSLSAQRVDELRGRVRGALCLAGEAGYEQARTIWNAMIDRHPAVVVRAAGAADVIQAVRFARDHGLLLAVRGGGHNIAGNAVCEGGLMIDLSPMKSVRIEPVGRTARVEPGVTLGEFDREAQAFGLAAPL